MIHCHPEYIPEATMEFLPFLKQQHGEWFPKMTEKKNLSTAADYRALWQQIQARQMSE